MRTFVQLKKDGQTVHWKFQAEEKPEFHPSIILMEITDTDPEPGEDWVWDGKKFNPPVEPATDPKIEATRNIVNLRSQIQDAMVTAILTGDKKDLQELADQLNNAKSILES